MRATKKGRMCLFLRFCFLKKWKICNWPTYGRNALMPREYGTTGLIKMVLKRFWYLCWRFAATSNVSNSALIKDWATIWPLMNFSILFHFVWCTVVKTFTTRESLQIVSVYKFTQSNSNICEKFWTPINWETLILKVRLL